MGFSSRNLVPPGSSEPEIEFIQGGGSIGAGPVERSFSGSQTGWQERNSPGSKFFLLLYKIIERSR